MAYTLVPTESKKQINKAGKTIGEGDFFTFGYDDALNLANKWRACHAYPINTFQATLRNKVKDCSNAIVAQRLKRMPTIIDKLRRFPNMQLTTMQDIAGLRVILETKDDVNMVIDRYVYNKSFPHEFVDIYDYINKPRDEDGYRSIHMVYKYKNPRRNDYDGLRLEIQFRTKLQHIWATAVETMGTFLGQALKSRQGDQEWLDFFCITSSAFSFLEGTARVPRFSHLNKKETFAEVARLEKKLGALEKMKSFSTVIDSLGDRKKYTYHLIVLNSLEHSVKIYTYDRDSFDQALEDYAKFENEAARGNKIEPVLVSAGPMESLKKAYPNLFLDITEFETALKRIIK
jgi:putative GTP pyrophosphokinase